MTEHQQFQPSGERPPTSGPPIPPAIKLLAEQTLPVPPAAAVPTLRAEEPVILGFPAEFTSGHIPPIAEPAPPAGWAPAAPVGVASVPEIGVPAPSAAHLVVLRRTERLGGLALILAGAAAAASLWLPWYRAAEATGLLLVREGLSVSASGPRALGLSGLWQPLVVVLGGGILLVLGGLLFRRARSHRVVGVVALLVALAAADGVVVPLADANWSAGSFGPGMWLAVAVSLLGVLGALKAMLTAPLVRMVPG
jgi:hypothetical protein